MATRTIEPGTRVRTFWDKDTVGVKQKGKVLPFDDPRVSSPDGLTLAERGLSEHLPVLWDGETVPVWWTISNMRRIPVKRVKQSKRTK